MASRLSPIRIGDSLVRTYTIYNPKPEEDWANPNVPEADTTSPMDLTGSTVTWCLRNGHSTRVYGTSDGVTVTPLLGKIVVNIDEAVTETWTRDRSGNSYLNIRDAAGNETSKCQLREIVVEQHEDA